MLYTPDQEFIAEGIDLASRETYGGVAGQGRHGSTLPPACFRSHLAHLLEDDRVWTRNWVCVGSSHSIPDPLDLLPYTVGDHGIHVQRQRDGGLLGRFNKAQHGGCRVIPGQCQVGRKTKCSFTSCGFSRDRDAISAAELGDGEEMTGPMRQYLGMAPERLWPISVASLGPMVFVHLDPRHDGRQQGFTFAEVSTGDSALGELLAVPDDWDMRHWWQEEEANWKLVGRGFFADTAGEGCGHGLVRGPLRDNGGETGVRQPLAGYWLFPNLVFLRDEDYLLAVVLQPTATTATMMRVHLFSAPEHSAVAETRERQRLGMIGSAARELQSVLSQWGTSAAPETRAGIPPAESNGTFAAFLAHFVECLTTQPISSDSMLANDRASS